MKSAQQLKENQNKIQALEGKINGLEAEMVAFKAELKAEGKSASEILVLLSEMTRLLSEDKHQLNLLLEEKLRREQQASAAAAVPSPTATKRAREHMYFIVKGSIEKAKTHSGYRKRIYGDAQEFRACYNLEAPEESIWYPPDSTNLNICLLFKEETHAHDFLARMVNYNSTHAILRERVNFIQRIEKYLSQEEALYIFKDAYIFDDSDSPANTGADIASNTEVVFEGNPLIQMRSLEDLGKLKKFETAYKCHIAPKAFYGEHKNDPDNIIYGSHLFHTYFDGDGKRRPDGVDSSWGVPPRLQVQFESASERGFVFGDTTYYRIVVRIVFLDPEVARAMDGLWREGYERVNDLTFRSFFYSSNSEQTKRFLEIKAKETETRWQIPADEI